MTETVRRRGIFRVLGVVMTLVIAMLGVTGMRSYAADVDYYPTWDEYKAAGQPTDTWKDVANAIRDVLEASYTLYEQGDKDEAYKAVLNTYNFYYETSGFERSVNGYSGAEVSRAELQFKTARKSVKKGESLSTVREEYDELESILYEQASHLDGPDSSDSASNGWVTFLACFGIILREGLEAILVVGAIIAYLVKSGNKDKLKYVYAGSVIAIIASFICAWLLNRLKLANTANQEIIEGVTALIAVAVLFYVSNWMINKSETEAWTKYIDDQVKVSAAKGSVFTLGFTAFLAVFREEAEVILFYQPLLGENSDTKMVWGGFALGCVILVFVFLIIRFLGVKIPLKPFFTATSILMFAMSISFLGSGIKELIEGDVIDMTSPEWLQKLIPFNDVLDVLGVYPVSQTLIPQFILLAITIVIYVVHYKKVSARREKSANADGKA